MKLRDLKPSDRFLAKFYASAEDAQADEPCLVIRGVFVGVYADNTDYCVIEIGGQKAFEDSGLEVERIDHE